MTHIEALVYRAVGDTFTIASVIYERLRVTVPTKSRVDAALIALDRDALIALTTATVKDIRADAILIENPMGFKYTGARRRPKDRPYAVPGYPA